MAYEITGKRVWVSGHNGMVGSSIVSRLKSEDCEVLVSDRSIDLRDSTMVRNWMERHRPQAMIVAAAKVGGILANDSRPPSSYTTT